VGGLEAMRTTPAVALGITDRVWSVALFLGTSAPPQKPTACALAGAGRDHPRGGAHRAHQGLPVGLPVELPPGRGRGLTR
jgi:hypothetical protein